MLKEFQSDASKGRHFEVKQRRTALAGFNVEHPFKPLLWEGEEPVETFREFFNRGVVVEGVGVFRPSGSLLRVDAVAIAPASSQDEFFRRVPSAAAQRDYHKLARLKAGDKSAYAQLRGWLPGDESDEEFEAAVVAWR